MNQQETARLEILSGWKEIANYLGKGVRTVQRYERDLGLPVHRLAGKPAGYVIATKSELDEWVTSPRMHIGLSAKRRALESRTNKLRAHFLLIDSEIALTFATIASGASNQEKRRRTAQTARTAYDTIMRLRKHTNLDEAERKKLDDNVQRLKSELQRLGQKV